MNKNNIEEEIKVGDIVCRISNIGWSSGYFDHTEGYNSYDHQFCPNNKVPVDEPVEVVGIMPRPNHIAYAVNYKGKLYGYSSKNIKLIKRKVVEIEDD